jgi:hypothetical protein
MTVMLTAGIQQQAWCWQQQLWFDEQQAFQAGHSLVGTAVSGELRIY